MSSNKFASVPVLDLADIVFVSSHYVLNSHLYFYFSFIFQSTNV